MKTIYCICIIVLLSASLSGCDSFPKSQSRMQPLKTFAVAKDGDVEQQITFKYITTSSIEAKNKDGTSSYPRIYDEFYTSALDAFKNQNDRLAITQFVRVGVNFSNYQCKSWFDNLELLRTQLDTTKNQVNIGGNLMTTLMSLFEASTRTIGVTTASIGAFNATSDNVSVAFLLVDLEKTRQKIENRRSDMSFALNGLMTREFDNYQIAKAQLEEYDKTCSRSEVRNLLSQSLDFAEYRARLADNTTPANLVRANQGQIDLGKIIRGESLGIAARLSDPELLLIFAYYSGDPLASFVKKFDQDFGNILTKFGEKKSDAATIQLLQATANEVNLSADLRTLSGYQAAASQAKSQVLTDYATLKTAIEQINAQLKKNFISELPTASSITEAESATGIVDQLLAAIDGAKKAVEKKQAESTAATTETPATTTQPAAPPTPTEKPDFTALIKQLKELEETRSRIKSNIGVMQTNTSNIKTYISSVNFAARTQSLLRSDLVKKQN